MIRSVLSKLRLTRFILTLELAGNNNKNEFRFSYGRYFTEKIIITKPLASKFSNEEKQDILLWRNTLVSQYPAKVNVIELTKDNFTQPLSVKEILDELEISKDDYYRSLSISKDEDLEQHLKKKLNFCFVINYFDVALKA